MSNSRKVKYEDSLRYRIRLDDGESSSAWSDGGYTTISGITSDTLHVSGTYSISFDKASTANVNGFVAKEISSEGMDLNDVAIEGLLNVAIYLPSTAGVASVECRLVSDSALAFTNYVSWSTASLSTGWNHLKFPLVSGTQTGAGISWSSVKHMAVGVVMSTAGDTIADVRLDSAWISVPLLTQSA